MTREYVAGELLTPSLPVGVLHDPNTGEPTRAQLASSEDSVERALEAAHRAHELGEWRKTGWEARAADLSRFSAALEQRAEQLAVIDAEETGVPLSVTRVLAEQAAPVPAVLAAVAPSLLHERLPAEAGEVHQHWLPRGPAVVITPWNAPTSIAVGKVSFALAAGAPVVLKPSEWSPGSASLIAEAAQEADLPPGVFQVVHGGPDVASRIVRDDRVAAISLTGSLRAGLSVAKAAASRLVPTDLELSGNNPALVLPGADLDLVARELTHGMTLLNGQWCSAPRRVVVPSDTVEELKERLIAGLDALRIGPSTAPESQLGPLINQHQLHRLQHQVRELERHGAKAFRAGRVPAQSDGYFVHPQVLTNAPRRGGEELFGPIVQLVGYAAVEEAIELANDHPYGLAAYVFAPDTEQARVVGRELRAGLVRINTVQPGAPTADATCGLWGDSGQGSIGLAASLRFFTGARCVA